VIGGTVPATLRRRKQILHEISLLQPIRAAFECAGWKTVAAERFIG
jgi:hypothetical protein